MNDNEPDRAGERKLQPEARPALLSLLCILTFVGSAFMFLSFFFIGLFHDVIVELKGHPAFNLPGIDMVTATPAWVFMAGALAYAVAFAGAILMWKLRRRGFHVYTLSQFALLFLTTFALFPGRPAIGDILFSASFVLFYAMHLRFMK